MNKLNKLILILLIFKCLNIYAQTHTYNSPIVLAYFPSYSESWASTNQNSKLREIPSFINYVFLAFAKPNLTYTKGSFDISGTGIEVPYDGCALKESVSALKAKGVHVILSIGGETYWGTPSAYNINYQQIKDLVDDIGFVGIDWDFEPDGSFAQIGSTTNVQRFKDFITNSRALMPKSQGYIIACAPSGVGALGGQINDDGNSPFKYANRNTLTGESDANLYNATVATNGINLFGFGATGHMIPVFQEVGNKIDIVAFQGYNVGASTNRSIMYDAYAYYAETYGFKVVAGVHVPNEPWGPYYTYSHQNVASLSNHIKNHPQRIGDKDGIMLWQLLMTHSASSSSGYTFMNVASQVLNGTSIITAVANSSSYSLSSYTGGATGCGSNQGGSTYCGYAAYNVSQSYPTANTMVYHNCKIWKNQWWANPNESPGSNSVWTEVSNCSSGPGCTLENDSFEWSQLLNVYVDQNNIVVKLDDINNNIDQIQLINLNGQKIVEMSNNSKVYLIDISNLGQGVYIVKCKINGQSVFKKLLID